MQPTIKSALKIKSLVRENILNLTPYSSARSEFKGHADIFMDANESPFETGLNRYPDPLATKVRERLGALKNIDPDQIMLGNGSDELVDYVTRIFCRPGIDNVIALPPTFGMYKVAAGINDIACRMVNLTPDFDIPVEEVMAVTDEYSRVLWLCSPNNPSGNLMTASKVEYLLHHFPGIVVLDEAYVEYIPEASFLSRLAEFPNLIITQTMSKAWGAAGIRLGAAYASPFIISMMKAIKPPYNVNELTQQKALEILANPDVIANNIAFLVRAREEMQAALTALPFVEHIFPSVTNFLLIRFKDANAVYRYLLDHGLVVRNRSTQPNCDNCLRITVGTAAENERLLKLLGKYDNAPTA
ncbi:MAG: histidinol-phosphate transaminase [Bacteroidota bacterium]